MQKLLPVFLVLVAILSRLLPHEPNFTALGAVALYSGVRFKGVWAYLIPFAILLISDAFLGFHSTMYAVYLGFFAVVFFSSWVQPEKSQYRFMGTVLSTSLIFFFISNFGVWLSGGLYPKTWAGLMECFAMAIPFLKTQITADFVFTLVVFGLDQFVLKKVPQKIKDPGSSF